MGDLVGKVLGKYEIVEHLGSGGMADVYRAYQPGPERYVSLKVLHSQLAQREGFVNRFKREAQAVARLRHQHIVQLHDFDVAYGMCYMVMELIEGGTLADRLNTLAVQGQRMPLNKVTHILQAIASAVDEAHQEDIIHRDIKPSNILFTDDGEPVLTDFGIARLVDSDQRTKSGAISGTVDYMSPEQIQGQEVDGRSDVYSLGVVLYEMVTGQVPFSADTSAAVMIKHINELPPPPRTLNLALPAAAEQVILRALAKSPDLRPQSAGQLAQEWADAMSLVSAGDTLPAATPDTIPMTSSHEREEAIPQSAVSSTTDTFVSVGANRLVLPLAIAAVLTLALALVDLMRAMSPELLTAIGVVVGLFSSLIFEFGERLFGGDFSRQVALRLARLGAFLQRGIIVLSLLILIGSLAVFIIPRVLPGDPAAMAHNKRGEELMQQWESGCDDCAIEALAEFEHAVEIDPDYDQAQENLAQAKKAAAVAYNDRGVQLIRIGCGDCPSKALKEFQTAIDLDPDYAKAHYNLAWVYEELLNEEKAISEYLLALEKGSGLDRAYNNLARLYIRRKDYAKAIEILDRGENVLHKHTQDGKPVDAQVRCALYKNFGWVYLELEEHQRALTYLQQSVDICPDYADTYYFMGRVYQAQGEIEKAIEALTRFDQYADGENEWRVDVERRLQELDGDGDAPTTHSGSPVNERLI